MRENTAAVAVLSTVAALVGADLLADAWSGAGLLHLGIEAAATAGAALGALWFLRRLLAERAEAQHWRGCAEDLLAGVGQTVADQFAAWELSPAEQEVGLLLLKGLSFKEIAQVRDTSERTAREQARAVYKKAELAGRAELSAFFIEDLLPPSG